MQKTERRTFLKAAGLGAAALSVSARSALAVNRHEKLRRKKAKKHEGE